MRKIYSSFFIFLLYFTLSAQNEIFIPLQPTPVIDGHFSNGEWDFAGLISIDLSPNITTTVKYMYDQNNLYLAFIENLQSQNVRFPEVLIDVNHDEAATYQPDDWWFHVSATNCEYRGQYGNYDSCAAARLNWVGVPNFTMGNTVDTVEIEIPFSTLGINPQPGDTIGICFLTTNTFSAWSYWPMGADHNSPQSWGNAIFSGTIATGEKSMQQQWGIYPIPSNGIITVTPPTGLDLENTIVQIVDNSGKRVFQQELKPLNGTGHQLNTNLSPGTYQLHITNRNQAFTQKIIIVDNH